MSFKTCRTKIRNASIRIKNLSALLAPDHVDRRIRRDAMKGIETELKLISECADHLDELVKECIEEAEAAKKLAAESQVRIMALSTGSC